MDELKSKFPSKPKQKGIIECGKGVKLQKSGMSQPSPVQTKEDIPINSNIDINIVSPPISEKLQEASPLLEPLGAIAEEQELLAEIDNPLLMNFTHQIINPLNAVVGTIDNIIDGTVPAEKRDQRLSAVRGQLYMTIELVRNLAYLSQLTTKSGRESLRAKLGVCVIPKVAVNSAEFFQEFADHKGVKISILDSETQYTVR